MVMRVGLGKYAPDLPPISNPGLTSALNMRPKVGGWYPLQGLANLAGATALTARPRGAISGSTADGGGYSMAGDATKLYVQTDSATTDRSRVPGYVLGERDRWAFANFGKYVFAATRNDEIQYSIIGNATAFQDVGSGAPRARHLVVAANKFLMAGNTVDDFGVNPGAIRWCGINQPLFWPTPGTDEAISVQSGRQPLEGSGGAVHDIVAGSEVTIIFREKSIHRADYVAGDAIFQLPEVDRQHGMMIPYSGAAFGRNTFYIAEDGFRTFDTNKSLNIGKGKTNDTFFADLDFDYIDRVWTAKDPDDTVIWVLYPGSGHVDGAPNKLLLWDYELDQWSNAEIDAEALIENVTNTPSSLDAPGTAADPDDVDDAGTGPASFDDRLVGEGNSRMGAYDSLFIASDFTGAKLRGVAETGDMELNPGGRALTVSVRPLVSNREARVAVATKSNLNDPDGAFGPLQEQDPDGKCSIRAEGRYHRFRIELPAGWNNAVGMYVVAAASGGR